MVKSTGSRMRLPDFLSCFPSVQLGKLGQIMEPLHDSVSSSAKKKNAKTCIHRVLQVKSIESTYYFYHTASVQ